MVVVTEVLAGATIGKLVESVYNYIDNKVKDRVTRSSMNAEVDKLCKALPKIQAVLSATAKAHITIDEMDPGFIAWMWQLRDAVDAADNLLDDIDYQKIDKEFKSEDEKSGHSEVQLRYESDCKGVKMCCTAFVSKCTMKNMKHALQDDPILVQLRGVVKQLDEVATCVGEFVQLVSLLEQRTSRDEKHIEIARDRETGFLLIERNLFGHVEEKKELIEWLLNSRLGIE
ncbi:hypothetical protein LUZ60_008229 [Juncus effusus]|nr:hypothetical protein LUZ60_008229 [Juncus effusus]